MKYVYIMQSLTYTQHFYTGMTDDLKTRLSIHNSGAVTHTAKYRPWHIKSYVAFADGTHASAFEKYLKTGSRATKYCCSSGLFSIDRLDVFHQTEEPFRKRGVDVHCAFQ
jgi:predicted GIY-YIG superfamily endonuclease